MATLTDQQLKDLQDKVSQLVADKGTADQKTQASNAADAVAVQANHAAAVGKLEEQVADAQVTADLTDLQIFIEALAAPEPPPPQP